MEILFVTATRIGDAVLSTGLLSYLIDRYPGAALTIAAGPLAAPLFESIPGCTRVVVVDLRGSALAWLLRAGERRAMAKGDAREHRVRQLGRLFGLDPPPGPRLWTTPGHERAAAELIPAGGPALA